MWSPPPNGVLKFNADGTARGKPGAADSSGILRNHRGDVMFMFSKHVGIIHSNEAEVLAILETKIFCVPHFDGSVIVE